MMIMKNFKQIVLFDLDRTIFDSDKFVEVLDQFLRQEINPEIELLKATKEVEHNFDFEKYLEQFKLKIDDQLLEKFVNFTRDDFWLGNAKEVIQKTLKNKQQIGILTYGGNNIQKFKMKLLKINFGYIITQNKCKTCLIKSWKKDGVYKIKFDNQQQSLAADKIILIDDKQSNVNDMPDDCLGLHFVEKTVGNKITDLNQLFEYL